ncbi:3-deoxy-manno-octulosonate-8-phosphatase KdsC [Vibrio sinaloensis]|uniref:3-deoxy-manno-octulosonate-8-phosphatase KdsC n=1 Tax=Photobacterium sp. (strain ATCC 43367) TaxID=379097 RepID=UPI00206ECB38|nr:3-deoxy-manno-octulosonate-8-phosphatase KdsC [Vibrio sinaloensis]UPQ88111.1 3-deoxy-manno-octulosonate-8-phosphatase KdsC [Vibrio sinaloensis]
MLKFFSELYKPVSPNVGLCAKNIKLLICDVDGVLSDGRVYLGNHGEELKAFHTKDGFGLRSLMKSGVDIAIITGRESKIVADRMEYLGIDLVYQGVEDKICAYKDITARTNIDPSQICYIGDDLVDLPVMDLVGIKAAVADCHPILKRHANYVTVTNGGFGAVREVCDLILAAKNELGKNIVLSA